MKNIDDMRVGDFLYLMDCMQEECCESTCPNCRYFDFCEIDMSSIDSSSIERTVEGYAEANCLLDYMHYVNQKWIPVSESLPKSNQIVLVTEDGEVKLCTYEHWYGYGYGFYGSRGNVTAWMPLPEPYTPYKGDTE